MLAEKAAEAARIAKEKADAEIAKAKADAAEQLRAKEEQARAQVTPFFQNQIYLSILTRLTSSVSVYVMFNRCQQEKMRKELEAEMAKKSAEVEKERQQRLKAEADKSRLLQDHGQGTVDAIQKKDLANKNDELAQMRDEMKAQVRANEAQVRAQVVCRVRVSGI